jgi:ABC-type transport system substrate-binding protein
LSAEETEAILTKRNGLMKPDADYLLFYTAGFAGGVDPVQPLNAYFSADGSRPVFTTPEITNAIREARATMNDKKRGELINKAVKLILGEVGVIPITNNISLYAMRKNIDFTPTKGTNFDYLLVKDMNFK